VVNSFTSLVNKVHSTLQVLPALIEKEGRRKVFCDIDKHLFSLANLRKTFNPEEEEKAKKIFQQQFLPFLNETKFCKHIVDKPYGYAGDFMAMEMIHDSFVNSDSNGNDLSVLLITTII